MKSLILSVALMFSVPVFAQEPIPPVALPAASPAVAALAVPAPTEQPTEPKAMTEEDVDKLLESDAGIKDVMANAEAVLAAYQTVKKAKGSKPTMLAIFAGLAILFKLLLSLLKITTKTKVMWKGKKAKAVLRLSTVILGLAVFLCANLGLGMSWFDALFLGLSGPGAMVIHELTKFKEEVKEEPKK